MGHEYRQLKQIWCSVSIAREDNKVSAVLTTWPFASNEVLDSLSGDSGLLLER